MMRHMQRSFDSLGTALCDVTFCVLDLETTGGAPKTDLITEVGAVKVRGGECLGTFQTLVDPGCAIPPSITVLTGITQAMTARAPRIEAVLPSLVEFMSDAVIVGHNVRFDIGFIQAALRRDQRPGLTNRRLDTCALARRLLAGEVPNHKLSTLAERLRLDHRPSHRALDDALATTDLLHILIERATALGVTGLDDLLGLPTITQSRHASKLALTDDLPRAPGVYVFRDRRGEPLYVGKATNLRSRVRSYFNADRRRKVQQLLAEAHDIDHRECESTLEAAVRELRLIQSHQPRFNRQGKRAPKPCWVKVTNEAFPRLSIARTHKDDGGTYLGPLRSRRAAQDIVDAIHSVVPLRRCTDNPRTATRSGPCAAAQIGTAMCPCADGCDPARYDQHVAVVRRAIESDPSVLVERLEARMQRCAAEERFEDAARLRDRAAALVRSVERLRRIAVLQRAGSITLRLDGALVHIVDGVLASDPSRLIDDLLPGSGEPAAAAEESLCVAAELERRIDDIELLEVSGSYASLLPRLPDFSPATE